MARPHRRDRSSAGPPRPIHGPADRADRPSRRWSPGWLALLGLGALATAVVVTGVVGRGEERAERLRAECLAAHQAGDYAAEERLAIRWMGARPGAAEPIYFLAQAQLGLGKKREAADTLNRLPDGDRLTLQGLSDRADLLFGELKDPREGVRTCERILALDPRNLDAHRRLCFFYAVTLDREKLAAQTRQTIQVGSETPETYVYLVGSDWLTLSNTVAVNSHWLQSAPDDERFLVAAARGFVSNSGLEEDVADQDGGDEDAAPAVPEHDRRLRELLARFPSNLELLAYFIQKATTRADRDEVTTLLGQAPPEAVDDNRFWRFKAWVHDLDGEGDEAVAAFRRALELDPYDFSSQHQLAGALRKQGNLEEAARLSKLAAEGRALRKKILEQPDVRAVPPAVLAEMAAYARGCGDGDTADRLEVRIRQIHSPSAKSTQASASTGQPIP